MCAKYYRNWSAFVENIVKWKTVTVFLDHSVHVSHSTHNLWYPVWGQRYKVSKAQALNAPQWSNTVKNYPHHCQSGTDLMLRASNSDCVLLSVSIAVGDLVGVSMSPNPVNPANKQSYTHEHTNRTQQAFIDIRLCPGIITPLMAIVARCSLHVSVSRPLQPNVTSSIKPEAHNIAQCRQRRTEPRPWDLHTKFCEDQSRGSRDMLANWQTDHTHTDRWVDHNTGAE